MKVSLGVLNKNGLSAAKDSFQYGLRYKAPLMKKKILRLSSRLQFFFLLSSLQKAFLCAKKPRRRTTHTAPLFTIFLVGFFSLFLLFYGFLTFLLLFPAALSRLFYGFFLWETNVFCFTRYFTFPTVFRFFWILMSFYVVLFIFLRIFCRFLCFF